jgi:uncharacterized protein YqjF (DUF2071 family)
VDPGATVNVAIQPFLTAEWRWLVMVNYVVEPSIVLPFMPRGTELDLWNGRTIASMVGFRFLRTRVCGCVVPLHQNFEEVNLRFYVHRRIGDHARRGVVFIKEIVPRRAIAAVARLVYNEQYIALPMRHRLPAVPENGGEFTYGWKSNGRWSELGAETTGELAPIGEGSEAEFIFEHYWGYSRQRDLSTVEYAVEHPPWRVWHAVAPRLSREAAALYGQSFADVLARPPQSVFVAEGSPVIVRRGVRLNEQVRDVDV